MRVDHLCEGVLSQESAVHHVKLNLYRHLQRHTLAPSPSVSLDSFVQSVSLRPRSHFATSSLESSAPSGKWLKCFEFRTLAEPGFSRFGGERFPIGGYFLITVMGLTD